MYTYHNLSLFLVAETQYVHIHLKKGKPRNRHYEKVQLDHFEYILCIKGGIKKMHTVP